jgi:SAM-dependent methyltransferase
MVRKCACCGRNGKIGLFAALPDYYKAMSNRYHMPEHITEFLNEEEYTCKYCSTTDRGRMICAFLQMAKLSFAKKGTRILHIAPEKGIENWILRNCPNVLYESTDLYNEDVSFQSDIQNMECIEDETYDYFICSHVLEHVQDDEKAIRELARILKGDGIGVLLVPIWLDLEDIDEEWGLTESENWRRFGQNDHCRIYSKNGLVERLKKNGFFVHIFDKSIFGEKLFEENAFIETSTLYILSKSEDNTDKLLEKIQKKQCYEDYRYSLKLLFSSCVLINNIMYTVTNLGGIPLKIDLQNQVMSCIDKWDKNYVVNCENMIVDGDNIYLLGIDGYYILKYNINSNQCHKIRIDCHTNDWGNYVACAKYKRNIYIFPRYMSKIVKVDIDKDIVVSNIKYCLYNEDGKEEVNFECGIQEENLLWLFQKEERLVMAYDMETDYWKSYTLPQNIKCCVYVVLKNGIFYILSLEGKVYSWDVQDNSMRMIANCCDRLKSINSFARIVVTDKIIYLLPALSESIHKIDIETGKTEIYDEYPSDFQYIEPEGWCKYFDYCEDKDYYYFAMRSSVYIFCVNKKNGAIRWIHPRISVEEYFNAQIKYSGMMTFEEGMWNIKNLMSIKKDFLKKDDKHYSVENPIWKQLKEN